MAWWSNIGRELYKATPLDNIVRGVEAARSGNWGQVAREVGGGAIDIGLMALPGGAALRGARAAGAGLGRAALAGAGGALGVPGAARTFGRAGAKTLIGRGAVLGAGLVGAPAGRAAINVASGALVPSRVTAMPSAVAPTGSMFMTADQAERRAQNAGALDAALNRASNAFGSATTAPPVDTSAVTGVGAPTGDMLDVYQQDLRQYQEEYERRMAELAEAQALAEEDYRLGTRRSRRGTAGRSANLSALLAATGLDLSPAAAEGGLGYEAQRGARELARLERDRMATRTGVTRAGAEADAERKRRIAELNRFLMTGPAAAAGNAPVPGM